MRAGLVDTRGENDLLVFWDTFNKFCTGQGYMYGAVAYWCVLIIRPKIHIRI
jgi:hypothetical protein